MNFLTLLIIFALECVVINYAAEETLTNCTTENVPVRIHVRTANNIENVKCRPDGRRLKKFSQQGCNACGRVKKKNPQHIANGDSIVPSNKYPWMVSLETVSGRKQCQGAIINEYFILTTAHCLRAKTYPPGRNKGRQSHIPRPAPYYPPRLNINATPPTRELSIDYARPENILVAFLTSTAETRPRSAVSEVIPHEDYDGFRHDIGLLRLKEKITCDEFASPICLPTGEMDLTGRGKLTVSGWDRLNTKSKKQADALHETKLVSLPFEKCSRLDPRLQSLNDTYSCVKGVKESNVCFGDSGSTMVKKVQSKAFALGVASRFTKRNCVVKFPMLFTSVSAHMTWIKEKMKDTKNGQKKKKHQRQH